jgi:hypothetical protein
MTKKQIASGKTAVTFNSEARKAAKNPTIETRRARAQVPTTGKPGKMKQPFHKRVASHMPRVSQAPLSLGKRLPAIPSIQIINTEEGMTRLHWIAIGLILSFASNVMWLIVGWAWRSLA